MVLEVKSDTVLYDYNDMVIGRIVKDLGKYYTSGLYCEDLKTSHLPYIGQIHHLFFNLAATTQQEAIDYVGECATEYYCLGPDTIHNIKVLGEFTPALLQQQMQA